MDDNKIRVPAAIGEFDLDQLYKGQPRPYRIQSVSKFQVVERDFAFVMPKTLKVGDVMKDIRKAAGGLLLNVDVFDLYEGDKMEAGKNLWPFACGCKIRMPHCRKHKSTKSPQRCWRV